MNWMFLTCVLAFMVPPYLDLSKAGAGVYADAGSWADPEDSPSVRLGVLGPENSALGREMRVAIQMAIEEANATGGYRLRRSTASVKRDQSAGPSAERFIPYEMVFRADDGPWGAAASQVVRLVGEDQVWTIIGGLDGQHTHLAELVVAKAWVPVITPAAMDSTIDYANVPWVFRAMPTDRQQAELLISHARGKGFQRLVLVTEGEREAVAAKRRLLEAARRQHVHFSRQFEYPAEAGEEMIPRILESQPDAILLWGRMESALPLVQAIRREGLAAPILTSSLLAVPEVEDAAIRLGELIVAASCDLTDPAGRLESFRARFRTRTGRQPGPVGIYSYDVARLVIRTIEKQGLNHTRIRNGLMAADYDGLAGKFQFESLGGSRLQPVLLTLEPSGWQKVSAERALVPADPNSRGINR